MTHAPRRTLLAALIATLLLPLALIQDRAEAEVPGQNGRIAYVTDSKGCDDCHIFTVAPDGSDRVRLTDESIGGPRWSPDGTRVTFGAFTEDGRIGTGLMNADGTGLTVFEIPDPTLNLPCWGWSPDGSRLACEGWDDTRPDRLPGIFTVDSTDGQDLVRLTSNPFGDHDLPGDFSPDGSRYVFVRFNPERRNGNVALFTVNTDGTGVTRLTPWTLGACCGPSWSPDGEHILFDVGGALFTIRPDGTELQEVPMNTGAGFAYAFDPSWSPDGTRYVFSMYLRRTDQVDIFTAAGDGSDVQQITDTGREEGFADWGPSGA